MKRNKIISVIATLLTLAMLIGLFPTAAFAAQNQSTLNVEESQDSGDVEVTEDQIADAIAETSQSNASAQSVSSGSDRTGGRKGTITPITKVMNLYYNRTHLNGGTFPLKTITGDIDLLGDVAFCVQHEKPTPRKGVEMRFVGKMTEDVEVDFTDGLTPLFVYRVIMVAKDIINKPKYAAMTVNQKLQAVQNVIHHPDKFYDRYMNGVAGGDYNATQAKLFGELYKEIDTAARASTLQLPTQQPVTARQTGGKYYSGDRYVLATYSLNYSGVTAKISSTNVSGATATVSGSTLTVSIPAKNMPKSGTVSVGVDLTAPEQELINLDLYTEGSGTMQVLVVPQKAYYNPIGTVSATMPIPEGETGMVEVTKVEAGNTGHKLSGAIFIITNKDTGAVIPLPATDSNGHTANVNPLPIGRYTITESIAPEGYARSNWSADFEVKADETTKLSYTVENRSKKATWQPCGVTKVFVVPSSSSGASMECTFELLQDGVVIQTKTVTAKSGSFESVKFDPVQFAEEDNGKSFVFTIREKDTGEPGVWYSKGEVTIQVRIENYEVQSSIPSISGTDIWCMNQNWSSDWWAPEFINYVPIGSWTPHVTKSFNGSLTDDQFEFVLEEDGRELQRVKNKADGSIPFTAIQYTADDIGRHTYTIREINGGDENIHYDDHVVTFVVDVSYSGYFYGSTASLSIPPDRTNLTVTESSTEGSTTFTNRIQKKGNWTPSASKTLEGSTLKDGQFTFVLEDEEGNELQEATNKADGSITFDPIEYTLADVGEHTYTIWEVVDGQLGVIYDRHILTYTVTVSESSDKLTVLVLADGSQTFVNRYETVRVTVTKNWIDGNQIGQRGDVKLTMLGSNGDEAYGTIHPGESSYTWDNLTKYDVDGELIEYTVVEAEMDGYIYNVEKGPDGYTYTLTNTASTEVTVTKVWVDGNQESLRKDVELTLTGSDGSEYTGTIPKGESTYTWENLPKYDGKNTLITYTLSEVTVDGYTSRIEKGDDGYTFTVTNTHTAQETTYTVHKKWADNGNQDRARPTQITVTIKGSDGKTYTETFSGSGDEWTHTFEHLPKVTPSGDPITYSVESENAVPGYTPSISGDTITNTHTPGVVSVTVTKVWEDNDNQDGLRKDVELTLTGSDGSSRTGTIKLGDSTFTWSNLPVYKDGVKIEYTVTEATMDGYSAQIVKGTDGYTFTITNTHTPATTSVTVTKIWEDGNNQDGLRKDVQLTLTGSDGSSRTGTIKLGDSTFTWSNLPVYKDGVKIEYTLTEATMDGYSAQITKGADGYTFTITNTHAPALTDVTVTKVWEDNDNQDGLRKDVQLTLTGSDGSSRTGTIKLGQSTFTWTGLPEKKDGEIITYTVTEATMDGYSAQITKGADGYTFTVTNIHAPATTSVTVTKIWEDNDNQDGLREDVQLTLTGSDGQTYKGTIPVGEFTYTWSGLPEKKDGEIITYTVTEATMDGYSAQITKGADGYTFTITNTHTPATTSVTVTKVWEDGNNQDGLRKDVQLTLTGSDGSSRTGTIKLGDSTFTWSDLPVYKDGVKIEYTVTEATMDGYSAQITKGADGYTFTVTNTHTPATTSVTVTKVWEDGNNQDGLREDVQLTLTGSDGSSRTGTIKLGDSTYTWSDLPVYYNNGTKIEYTLTEATMDGYSAQITKGADGYTFTVTNNHTPATTQVKATKVWNDNDNQDGLRKDVELTLSGSDGKTYKGTIPVGQSSYTWSDLPIYWNNGTLIEYTVTEATMDGYSAQITKGADGYTFTITNTHAPAVVEIPVKKHWEDRGNELTVRPDNITFVLYGSDGSERMATVRGNGDDWSYTFTGLPKYWHNGTLIEYTLTELPVHGYTTDIQKGDDGYTFTVTNSIVYGRLHITKTAEDGLVEGLHFRIHGVSHQGTTVDLIIVTGADGVARADYILPGYYYVDEVDVPDRYVTPAQQTVIVIGDDSDPEITVLNFHNTLKRMTITVNKTAEDNILEGHKFRLTGKDYLGNDIDLVGTTDADGKVVFDNLLAGDYTVAEVETDVRYVVPDEQTVNLTWGVDESVSFENVLKRMTVTVNKTAEDNILEGHKFRLTGKDYLGNDIDLVGTTDADGKVVFDNLLAGEYTVTEIETAIRYVVPDAQDVTVTWGVDESVSFENILKRWNLTVQKTDESTGDAVSGAVYGIFKDGELLDEYTTDENGTFTTKDYLCGEGYTLKEISPAPGYTLDATEYRLVGTVAEICIEHLTHFDTDVTDTPTHVVITKTDVTTGQPVPGAEIVITDADGNEVFRAVTDENGQIEAFYLPVGVYTFTETVPASGYTLNPNSFTFEIHEDGTITGDTEFTDEPTHVVITKTDITTGQPVPGAEIVITDAEGNEVFRAVTDENGQIEAFYLPVGVYTFKETAAPDGYKLNTTVFTFEIHADGTVTGDTGIEDEPHRVVLDKKDKTSKAPVVGAVIEVYDADGNLIGRYTTNENGKVAIVGIKPGTYTYKEIEAPAGYVLDGTVHTFVLHEDGTATGETTFENAAIEPTPPKTGDNSLLLGGAALLSLVGGVLLLGKRRRKEDEE